MSTLFSTLTTDRSRVRWEDSLESLSPFERIDNIFFKREDYFAPLGYGGINGGKVRQLTWLVRKYIDAAKPGAKLGLLYAGSVRSPQIGRVPAVAAHFGIASTIVIGAALQTAVRHENVAIAAQFGASFVKAPAPYNPALQSCAKKLLAREEYRDFYQVEYGLSVEGTPDRIESFYRFASEQVRNLPDEVETLFVPAGSCNTTLAVLYGIARFEPRHLKRVVLISTGPTRVEWFEQRLALLEKQAGIPVATLFQRVYPHHPDLAARFGAAPSRYVLEHHDLFSTKWTSWDDEMHGVSHGGVDLHPSYEAKVMTYIRKHPKLFDAYVSSGRSAFWIVGSSPRWSAMAPHVSNGDAL